MNSEWQTVLICAMVVLLGMVAYLVYLNIRLNKVEKK